MLTQFDVHRHPQPGRRTYFPYLAIAQHERVLLYAGEALDVPVGRPLGLIDDD